MPNRKLFEKVAGIVIGVSKFVFDDGLSLSEANGGNGLVPLEYDAQGFSKEMGVVVVPLRIKVGLNGARSATWL